MHDEQPEVEGKDISREDEVARDQPQKLSEVDPSEQSTDEQTQPDEKRIKEEPEVESTGFEVSLSHLASQIKQMSLRLAHLDQIFENRLKYDKAKEDAFDRLYGELEVLKQDHQFDQLRPLYLDLILLHDRIENTRAHYDENAEGAEEFSEILKTLSSEVQEILYRREIEIIQTKSTEFDPTCQRAIDTVHTDESTENNSIACVIRKGFRHRGRILRSEEVIVKIYRAGEDQTD